ncbi:hypothetical protein BO94DRAFT_531524 [Aspergillus sclerotioniger CBS 115572]|uniref:Phosphatidylglycerol lysyltransferase C-terminal domain-containing protein n=1 Tax=Aspergillus sclerotioniger CBS 115572 TaxID=1450535 RepID=A0A317X7S1_9EURO|nr:hypothetical protein BO94DRAFT_531524 [Aspergillus sclerotioniger CBS 115572]PWY94579.1 hypothetical protein BO94DRAFT_531524 [Aspergillus sclerotioniger CBS 115572]
MNSEKPSKTSRKQKPLKAEPKILLADTIGQTLYERLLQARLDCAASIAHLAALHSQVSHMGLLDPSYSIFLNTTHTAALCFKVLHKTAIISGDPISHATDITSLLSEFQTYRKAHHLGIAFLGASPILTHYAHTHHQHWTMLHFGKERVLNPTTNAILHEQTGKRILLQTKHLLNPTKGGLTLDIYVPTANKDSDKERDKERDKDKDLERSLQSIYNTWRSTRNASSTPQAFITSYDLFPTFLPSQITYIYARNPVGEPIAFAALRYLGGKKGYHIDPCIADPTAPKGTTDLLLFSAIALCRTAGVSYLSIGYEPFDDLGEVIGLPGPLERVARRMYRFAFGRLPLAGKKAYHDKWKPDEGLEDPLYIVFPGGGVPDVRGVVALMHVANVKIRRVVLG